MLKLVHHKIIIIESSTECQKIFRKKLVRGQSENHQKIMKSSSASTSFQVLGYSFQDQWFADQYKKIGSESGKLAKWYKAV